MDLNEVPELFKSRVGPLQIVDYEKVYAAFGTEAPSPKMSVTPPGGDIFEARGIDRDGVVIVVHPDHYVAGIFTLDERDQLSDFLAQLFIEQ